MIYPPVLSIEIKERACKKFAEEMHYSDYTEVQAQEIAEQYHANIDGYQLAKDLESYCSWDIDANTVEDLDCVSGYVDDEMKIERKKWFDENDIQPPFGIGAELKQGVIHHIWDHDVACYCIKRWGETNETRFGIIRFENAQLKDA